MPTKNILPAENFTISQHMTALETQIPQEFKQKPTAESPVKNEMKKIELRSWVKREYVIL